MKKIPKPYLFLLSACALTVIVWMVEKPLEEKKGDILEIPLLQGIDLNSVAKIEIEYLLQGVVLKKENGEWFVADKKPVMKEKLEESQAKEKGIDPKTLPQEPLQWQPADPKKIELRFDILRDTELVSFVGDNPKKHGFFEVNAAGMQLKLFSAEGKLLAHFFLGKSGAGFMECYVRRNEQTAVYLADRNLRGLIPADAENWRIKEASVKKE